MKLQKELRLLVLVLLIALSQNAFAQAKYDKPVFVLVHGAWHGGWCWQEVSQRLTAQGYKVYTPTLSGLGEHKNTLNESVGLDTHISDIINLLTMEDLHNVVLVGHSYAGAVIEGVADSIPGRLRSLIFLDAIIAENGQSLHELQPAEMQASEQRNIDAKQPLAPFPVQIFGVTDPVKAAWVTARLTDQPFLTFAQQIKLHHALGNGLPRTYIACTNPQLPIMARMSEKAKSLGWQHVDMNTGHDAMITDPAGLSKLLSKLAQ
ncbi:alpha/beta fold hydrolase [Chitinophaga sp. Cy-1792]|uniref:alpha/beta fold hydrolase n=1 Tax=Chitinophaga sp. Cy-1792 TaxID=2608339 RepID=UPI00142444CD|nr:alpha/beta fold hydrolase [Chitinophaga sp. Cy-1792]NIG55517.1 alpha/beta hydrolase [Chitinophaga sp. Cy-1792]